MLADDNSFRLGIDPTVTIQNFSEEPVVVVSQCPRPPVNITNSPVDTSDAELSDLAGDCESEDITIASGEELQLDLGTWKYTLFNEPGTYEVQLPASGSGTVAATFAVHEPGFIIQTFRSFILKPLLNALVFIASWLPGYNLGLGIIILTVIIKLLLFWPTQRALEGQKKMQLLQPKLEAIRKQHKSDPQKLQQETMKLWKEHGVNPFQSCLPLLLQFPVLIGLFYVVQDSSVLERSQHLLYPVYQNLPWSFDPMFLGLDLTETFWIYAPILVALQFFQMKLTFQVAKNKKAKQKDDKPTEQEQAQKIQQNVMLYGLPLLIGFFSLGFPGAVSIYWGTSTVFAIGQQVIVNREHLRV